MQFSNREILTAQSDAWVSNLCLSISLLQAATMEIGRKKLIRHICAANMYISHLVMQRFPYYWAYDIVEPYFFFPQICLVNIYQNGNNNQRHSPCRDIGTAHKRRHTRYSGEHVALLGQCEWNNYTRVRARVCVQYAFSSRHRNWLLEPALVWLVLSTNKLSYCGDCLSNWL